MSRAYYSHHEIGAYSIDNIITCVTYCMTDYRCLSINWNTAGEMNNCILNNGTRWEENEVLVGNEVDGIDPDQWKYYEILYPIYDNWEFNLFIIISLKYAYTYLIYLTLNKLYKMWD